MSTAPSRQQTQTFYERFSVDVGLRDWLQPNPRHVQLRSLLAEAIGDLGGHQSAILDVGCGAGVMSAYLQRYGSVEGIDFSSPAIDAAAALVPGGDFRAGSLELLDPVATYDLITLFDVLEHIPACDRPDFVSSLAKRLKPRGRIFMSTPAPEYTAWRRARGDETLQVVDEEVRLGTLLVEARDAGLELIYFRGYDIWGGSPEYQAMVFARHAEPGLPPVLRMKRQEVRQRFFLSRTTILARRMFLALRLARHGRLAGALWMLRGDAPDVRS